ncbi:methyltransferase-like protein 4 isoform X1 [Eurytemora carolleeae]|uniref:methyltransferase-like protein 4 isoform X1 n=1 Tax=Eurytemora carolleeae TaxID=1294199 RepID=UPI000C76443A|nr:methyltransferase-like protein 4 isoform X1 [Eurytemora carolleeae]|eukprot:XP_023335543.1 methyltransferase-like protein 4 isoform X1 [Eurytemora affinis]
MSIIKKNIEDKIILLSHEQYILETYPAADPTWISKLFNIKTQFLMDGEALALANSLEGGGEQRKRKKRKMKDIDHSEFKTEIQFLEEKLKMIKHKFADVYSGAPSLEDIKENNKNLRIHVQQLMHALEGFNDGIESRGGNETDHVVEKQRILLPPDSQYRLCDINTLGLETTFDLILMDPPWENKHVKRKLDSNLGYSMLNNHQIKKIGVRELLNKDGLVAVWCSNNARHRAAIRDWFMHWGLKELATWYWIKLTRYGEPVCKFSCGKNPYEVLIIAARGGDYEVPQELVFGSIPSGIHSHKPPISHLLDLWFPNHRRRLEIFGRYLQPGWTTVGLEACKLNHINLFKSP